MKTRSIISAFAIAALILAGVTVVSVAANGGPVLLGHVNTATKPTAIKSSKGAALALKTRPNKPPLKVSSKTKVKKLNADMLDGLDGQSLQNRPNVYVAAPVVVSDATLSTPLSLPNGRYLISWQIALTLDTPDARVDCFILRDVPPLGGSSLDRYFAGSTLYAGDNLLVLNSTGYVEKLPGTVLSFECSSSTGMQTQAIQPTQFIVSKVDGLNATGTLTLSPRPGGGARN